MSHNQAPLIQLDWEKAAALISRAQKIAVLTHTEPDGDAIGSMMGMTLALRSIGKAVTPIVDGGLPARFAFIPSSGDVLASVDGVEADLIVSTDASDLQRLGVAGATLRERGLPLVQLDHHQTNLMFGDANLVDARTAAAAEGVFDMIQHYGWPLTPEIAKALLTGIVTDTIAFRTDATTGALLGKAQVLMENGADLSEIVQRTLQTIPTALMRFTAIVMQRLQLEPEGVMWVTITPDDYQQAGMPLDEYVGLSGYMIQSEDAVISAVIRGISDGIVDVSLRARPGYDVSEIALSLGGGGHVLAAGCKLKMSLDEAVNTLLPMLKAEAQRGQKRYS